MFLDRSPPSTGRPAFSAPVPHLVRIGTICVFGGAAEGHDPRLGRQVEALGHAIGRAGIRLVYGGGDEGLMGRVATAAVQAGGEVIAIAPRFLAGRMTDPAGVAQSIVVPDMAVRKTMMLDHADAIVALPGGIGTLDEVTEVLTLAKLGQHRVPLLLANFGGFWTPWLALMAHTDAAGFTRDCASACLVAEDPAEVLPMLRRDLAASRPLAATISA